MAQILSISKKTAVVGEQFSIIGSGFASAAPPVVFLGPFDLSSNVVYYSSTIVEVVVPLVPVDKYPVRVDDTPPFDGLTITTTKTEPQQGFGRDFQLANNRGVLEQTYLETSSIENAVALSLTVAKGSWFYDPSFGHEFETIGKVTPNIHSEIKNKAMSALKWLLDDGRISDVTILSELDNDIEQRVNVEVRAKDISGVEFKYSRFIEVV